MFFKSPRSQSLSEEHSDTWSSPITHRKLTFRDIIKVRDMPERDIESLGVMRLGAEGKLFYRPVVVAVPPKWVFAELPNPVFSDTYERSGRATGCYRLVMTLRFFLVFTKFGISSKEKYIF